MRRSHGQAPPRCGPARARDGALELRLRQPEPQRSDLVAEVPVHPAQRPRVVRRDRARVLELDQRRRLQRVRAAERDLHRHQHVAPAHDRRRLKRDLPPADAGLLLDRLGRELGRCRSSPAAQPAGREQHQLRLRPGPRLRREREPLLQLHRRLLRRRRGRQRHRDGRRALHRRRQVVSASDLLLVLLRRRSLQRQADDRGRLKSQDPEPVRWQRLRRLGRRERRVQRRRHPLRPVDRPRADLHRVANRCADWTRPLHRHDRRGRPQRRGVRRLERLRREPDRGEQLVRRRRYLRHAARHREPEPGLPGAHPRPVVPRRSALPNVRRRPVGGTPPRARELRVDGHEHRRQHRHLPFLLRRWRLHLVREARGDRWSGRRRPLQPMARRRPDHGPHRGHLLRHAQRLDGRAGGLRHLPRQLDRRRRHLRPQPARERRDLERARLQRRLPVREHRLRQPDRRLRGRRVLRRHRPPHLDGRTSTAPPPAAAAA